MLIDLIDGKILHFTLFQSDFAKEFFLVSWGDLEKWSETCWRVKSILLTSWMKPQIKTCWHKNVTDFCGAGLILKYTEHFFWKSFAFYNIYLCSQIQLSNYKVKPEFFIWFWLCGFWILTLTVAIAVIPTAGKVIWSRCWGINHKLQTFQCWWRAL